MTITGSEVLSLMKDAGWFNWFDDPINLISDREFQLLPESEYQQIIEQDKTDEQEWVADIGDCDNFAFELRSAFGRRGAACGVIHVQPDGWDTPHALFFYITDQRELRVIEPQTDTIFEGRFKLIAVTMY